MSDYASHIERGPYLDQAVFDLPNPRIDELYVV